MASRSSPHLRLAALLLALLGMTGLAGCGPANPLDAEVSAGSTRDFADWRAKTEPRLDDANKTELEIALQEFRHSITTFTREASDPATVEALLLQRIDGLPLRRLYIEGARLRILRLTPEHGALRAALESNHQQLATADAATAEALRARIARQTERLKKLSSEIEAAEARIRLLDTDSGPAGETPTLAAIQNR